MSQRCYLELAMELLDGVATRAVAQRCSRRDNCLCVYCSLSLKGLDPEEIEAAMGYPKDPRRTPITSSNDELENLLLMRGEDLEVTQEVRTLPGAACMYYGFSKFCPLHL